MYHHRLHFNDFSGCVYALSAFKSGGWLLQFTVNLAERNSHLLVTHVDLLRESVRLVKQRHPFFIDVMVIMYNHTPFDHC